MTDTPQTMPDILAQSIAGRENEVMMYQININNYVAAIADIDDNHAGDADMADFRARLDADLAATRREQKRAQLMLDAARLQLAGLS